MMQSRFLKTRCSLSSEINAIEGKLFICNRIPTSQAGRRGFDPRLPLFPFSNLGAHGVFNVTAITAFSPDPYGENPGWRVLTAPSGHLQSSSRLIVSRSVIEHSPPLIDYGRFQLTNRCQTIFQAGNDVIVFVHVHRIAHLC